MEAEKQAQFVFLKLALPGRPERNIGVFLLDGATGGLYFRIREDWDTIADPDEAELLSQLSGDFQRRIEELGNSGGEGFLRTLEDQLSNILRLTDRELIRVRDMRGALDTLFDENCVS
jgi:hypothetical protein